MNELLSLLQLSLTLSCVAYTLVMWMRERNASRPFRNDTRNLFRALNDDDLRDTYVKMIEGVSSKPQTLTREEQNEIFLAQLEISERWNRVVMTRRFEDRDFPF